MLSNLLWAVSLNINGMSKNMLWAERIIWIWDGRVIRPRGGELCLSILSSLGWLPGEAAPRHVCHFQQEWVSRKDRLCAEGWAVPLRGAKKCLAGSVLRTSASSSSFDNALKATGPCRDQSASQQRSRFHNPPGEERGAVGCLEIPWVYGERSSSHPTAALAQIPQLPWFWWMKAMGFWGRKYPVLPVVPSLRTREEN